jgi:hypothetical protein
MWFPVEDEVTKHKSKLFSRAVLGSALLLAMACGKDSSNGLPTAKLPTTSGGSLPTSSPTTDPRFPALLGKSVSISLTDPINFTGLRDLAKVIFTPVVETHFALSIPNNRDTVISAQMLVGFEDNKGFWGALMSTFEGTSTRTSDQIDLIFSDSELSFRVVAGISGDDFVSPRIYYRVRQSGETQCQKVTYTCQAFYPDGRPYYGSPNCPMPPPADTTAATCKTYMNLGNTAVKQLGTFSAKYSRFLN